MKSKINQKEFWSSSSLQWDILCSWTKITLMCPDPGYCLSDLPPCPSSQDIASQKFSMPSPVRTVIAADFDNDNELEVFFNNIAYRGPSSNRLFRCSLPHAHVTYSMYIVQWKPHKQCLYLIFWNGLQQPSGVAKCGPGMLISSGIPPSPAHMSESLIKMGSGLSSWLSCWVSPPDNINELAFQAAL